MADRAAWNRRRFLRAELLAVLCLLAFWACQTQPNPLKKAKTAFLEQVIKVVPTDHVGRYLGEHHRDRNRLSRAAIAYRHLALQEPNSIEAHIGLSNCYRALGKHEAAIDVLSRLLEACPNYAFGYLCQAYNYSDLTHYAEAIWAYEKALELEPKMATLHVRLGKTYVLIGDYHAAIPSFQKAVEADKRYADAHFELAKAYILTDRMDRARKHYRALETLNENLAAEIQEFGNL